MAKTRIKKQNKFFLNSDVILFEPQYIRLTEKEEFAPDGIDFGYKPNLIETKTELLIDKINKPDDITEKISNIILKLDFIIDKNFGNFLDDLHEKTYQRKIKRKSFLLRELHILKDKIISHQKQLIIIMIFFFSCIGLTSYLINEMTIYKYSFRGDKLGYSQSKKEVFEVINLVSALMNDEANVDLQFDQYNDITFVRLLTRNIKTDTQDEILKHFTYLRSLKGIGTAILINGERKVLVENEEIANEVLDKIKLQYNNNNVESIKISDNITMEEIETEILRFKDAKETYNILTTGGEDGSALIHVITSEIVEYSKILPYETVYENSEDIYLGNYAIKSQGKFGQAIITERISKINGVELNRNIISENVTSAPVTEIIYAGIKPKPLYMAKGYFIRPTEGRLSSTYGPRWGRQHEGIDISAPYGIPIVAADSGTVIFSGSASGYGLLIKIDHGNGFETRYGHCSQLYIKVGQKVLQGEVIGAIGSTGRSTGNHLHFEIRKNGDTRNPLLYVNY